MRIFFDTNVIRYFGEAFSAESLEPDLRSHIVLSPVSMLEAMSQLATSTRQQAFAAIQAMWNWLPERVAVLDLPPIFIRRSIHPNDDAEGDLTFDSITNAIQRCLHASSPDELLEPVQQLRALLEAAKQHDGETRQNAVLAMRTSILQSHRNGLSDDELQEAFRVSVATRAGANPNDPSVAVFVQAIPAYYLYDTVRLKSAVAIPEYNFLSKKRKNDLFDCEQLLYLAYPNAHFVTTDTGYKHLLSSEQGDRIHLLTQDTLRRRDTAMQQLCLILACQAHQQTGRTGLP